MQVVWINCLLDWLVAWFSYQTLHILDWVCGVFLFFCLFTNAIHMKQLFFETLELFNQFIELCKQYRIKFEHYYKRQMFVVELPDDLTTDMFLLETGFAN